MQFLSRHWYHYQGISWPFMHIMSDIHNKQKVWIKYTYESQDTFQVVVHGHNTIHILQKFNKRQYFSNCLLILGCLFQYSKTLWNVKYHYWGSHGNARYVSVKICKSRWIWLIGYGDNLNWRWNTFYLQVFSGRSFCKWCTTCISGTGPSGN